MNSQRNSVNIVYRLQYTFGGAGRILTGIGVGLGYLIGPVKSEYKPLLISLYKYTTTFSTTPRGDWYCPQWSPLIYSVP